MKVSDITVYFLGEDCSLKFGTYECGMTAIQLVCADGEPMATATVSFPEQYKSLGCPKDCVFIKDYSENKGIYGALLAAGVIERYSAYIQNTNGGVKVCQLRVTPQ